MFKRPADGSQGQLACCGVLTAVGVVTGFARASRGAKGGLERVEVAGLGRRSELGGLGHGLFTGLTELGLLAPDLSLGLGRCTLVGARSKAGPGQLGHGRDDLGILGGHLCIEGRAAIGHRTDARKMLAHDEQGALPVTDRIFRLGKLGRCGNTDREQCAGRGEVDKGLHGSFLASWGDEEPAKPRDGAKSV
jgi:hypothetical protein